MLQIGKAAADAALAGGKKSGLIQCLNTQLKN